MESYMGDDAEYYMEQQELEKREQEALRQARIDDDARRNRDWEKASAKANLVPSDPKNK